MITGYNTDVKHEGVVYHVQTEDGGRDNPVIVSLIYQGGRILASKKTSYAAILDSDGYLARLRQMLETQHRAMIQAVKIGALARFQASGSPSASGSPAAAAPPSPSPQPPARAVAPNAPSHPAPPTPAPAAAEPVTEKNLDQVILEYLASEIEKE